MPDAYQDGVFFHKSTRSLAMPDVRESLIAFYKLLKETFPLEGMVMHHFLPSSQSLLELHFIHDGGIHFLGRFIPFSREQTMFLRAFSLTGGVNAIPNSQEVRTAESVNNDLREFIENRPRAHLVCCLKGAGAPLGLLRLIGTEVGCFTEEHERRLGLLAIPLSFALVKVLREEEVQRFFSAHGYDTPSQSPHEDRRAHRHFGRAQERHGNGAQAVGDRCAGADPRGNRHGQGACRQRDPSQIAARGQALHQGQLRGHP